VQPPAAQPRVVPDTPETRPAPPLQPLDEVDALHEEEKLEAAGDMAGAERILLAALARDAGSLSALISLERLLRVQGRLSDIVGPVQALLRTDPTSPIGYQMLVRAYSTLDRVPDLQQAAESWIRATPRLETPYREIATVYRQRGDVPTALQVLQRGRERIGREEALSFELGDVYAGLGEAQRAAVEWAHFIGKDASGFNLVQRHAAALPDGGAQLLPLLVDQLTRGGTTPARRRAAATLAVDAGLGVQAEAIVRQVAAGLKGAELQGFLVEVARRADGARLPRLAYWAYAQMLAAGGPEARLLAVRSRLAELALAAGDTAAARSQFAVLEQASATGSPERRQALSLRIELAARSGDAAGAARALATFRQEFPDAVELDGVAAAVGNAWLARGQPDSAGQATAGVKGPRSSFVLGRIQLQRGNLGDARNALLAAAAGLRGSDATEAIGLVSLLGRLSPTGGQLLGRAVALTQEGKRKEAVDLLQKAAASLDESDRAPVLDYAAGVADHAGLDADAEALRRQIITVYPRALEAPAALLALGRALSDRPASFEEARQLLEKLVIDYPKSALVPEARRELDLLQGRIPRS
jgi:tetratricopeptide (TPR) repeat protein